MKKLALALVCLVSVAFFASCQKEFGAPTIQAVNGEELVANNDTVDLYQNCKFGFTMSSADASVALKSLVVTIDGTEWATVVLTGTTYNYVDSVSYIPGTEREIVGNSVITATVTDAAGKTAVATINLIINDPDIPLMTRTFSWNRHGGQPATGLEEFGLEWNSNAKEVFAQIKPMENVTLYEFDPEVWGTTTTVAEETALFNTALETGTAITVFNKVSAFASHDYDFVLGTIMDGAFHLIHITEGIVTTFKGTDVTINGEAK